MNIAIMAHDKKKELMVQFCIAYKGILEKHSLSATNTTGRLVAEATGLPITLYLSRAQGGQQQVGARIAYNEIDLVLFFTDPGCNDPVQEQNLLQIERLCDMHNVPICHKSGHCGNADAGPCRGDLDWREGNGKSAPLYDF